MKEYTVLLLYPDYIANEFGKETYLAWVTAQNPEDAVLTAQEKACPPWDGPPEEYGPEERLIAKMLGDTKWDREDGANFYPLLVVEGHLSDLTPDRWR